MGMNRTFETGATRDLDTDKLDYEGFLAPVFVEAFAAYMHVNRLMPDGSQRDSDNWQKGIPLDAYMKSHWRHFMEQWKIHRQTEFEGKAPLPGETLLAIMGQIFNLQGYFVELVKLVGDDWLEQEIEGFKAIRERELAARRQQAETPKTDDGWIEWRGGECPVDPETVVDVQYQNPSDSLLGSGYKASMYGWQHTKLFDGRGNIIRYRVVETPTTDDGWIEWKGGERPVDPETWVEYEMVNGMRRRRQAGTMMWHHHQPPCASCVIRYRVVETPKTEDKDTQTLRIRKMAGWIEWRGGECPVDPETLVDVEFQNGVFRRRCHANEFTWSRPQPADYYIIRYRVVENSNED